MDEKEGLSNHVVSIFISVGEFSAKLIKVHTH